MVEIFFDASALVKRYSAEPGSELVNELFERHPIEQMTCATIGLLEVVSVLVRKRNDGRLSSQLYSQAICEIDAELIENEMFSMASIDESLIFSALDLIALHNINATDALILNCCISIQQILQNEGHRLILWSCDKRLLRAAKQENIDTFDPEVGTQAELSALLAS